MKIKKPKIVSIVLTWNSADTIEECLNSLDRSSYKTDIIVVDNNSSDKTRDIILKKFPTIKLINTNVNLGYAGGNNVGIAQAINKHAEYIFILNPDAKVHVDCVNQLLKRIQDEKDLAGVSPKIYHSGSNEIYFAGSLIHWHNGVTTQPGGADRGQFNSTLYTERLSGCAMLLSVRAIKKVGIMDERFFLYYEETDWSISFQKAGFKLGLVVDALVWHKASSSTGGFLSPLYHYYMTRNKLLFIQKRRPLMLPLVILLSSLNNIYKLTIISKKYGLKKASLIMRAILEGYFDFVIRKFGRRDTI